MPDVTPGQVAGVVLAAGAARRFGDTKQLAELDGRPLVAHAVRTARAAGLDPVYVVVGHDADRVRDVLGDDVVVVDNPDHATGQASSLRAGVAAAGASTAAALVVLLADQPGIDPNLVRAVAGAHAVGHEVVRARYTDRPGHPVLFARAVWPRLTEVSGDVGARDLLEELGAAEVLVDTPAPPDVDRPADLDGLR